jgi:uncharacterized protein YkwD
MKISISALFLSVCVACGSPNVGDNTYQAVGIQEDPSTLTTQPPQFKSSTCGNMTDLECQIYGETNRARDNAGLQPLKIYSKCVNEAQFHSMDMAVNRFFAHDSVYETTWERFDRFGVIGSPRGENIAKGQKTAAAVVASWMASPAHRANILNPLFRSFGAGVAIDESGVNYFTQCFTSQEGDVL